MFEYTKAYLNPFRWAQSAYERTIQQSSVESLNVTPDSMLNRIEESVPEEVEPIVDHASWNRVSLNQLKILGGLFAAIERSHSYILGLRSIMESRVAESETRLNKLTNSLKTIRTSQTFAANTSIDIVGGDNSWIETDSRYYTDSALLDRNQDENAFHLRSTGRFSSIRSIKGFAGTIVIEEDLGRLIHTGLLGSIADGSRETYWSGVYFTPAPMRADSNDVPWLGSDYQHGYAMLLTYFLDRPTNVSEIYIDPISTEPIDLVSVRWTPSSVEDFVLGGTFESSGLTYWTSTGSAMWGGANGVGGSGCLKVLAPSGYVSQVFDIATQLTKVISGFSSIPGASDLTGYRFEISYNMKGFGDQYAGVRLVWLDSSGNVVDYKLDQSYPSGFYRNRVLVDTVPALAASGRIDVGIFTTTQSATALFDGISGKGGEQQWACNLKITGPTTISLPKSIQSSRFSFVIAQRNARQERIVRAAPTIPVEPIAGNPNLDPGLQKSTELLAHELNSIGSGETVWAYRLGLRELDLRYREYVPFGKLVSLPIQTSSEIRRVWVNAELGRQYQDLVSFFVYPFKDNEKIKLALNPYVLGELNSVEVGNISQGSPLYFFTSEEVASGWVTENLNYSIIDPAKQTEIFDGTDINGMIQPSVAPHLSRVRMGVVQRWLGSYSLWPTSFDPNAQVLYGIESGSLRDTIREEGLAGTLSIPSSSFLQSTGYIPIKVTVKTANWTAVPDLFGRPDLNRIRRVDGEVLSEGSKVETVIQTQKEVISYEAWLGVTTLDRVQNYPSIRGPLRSLLIPSNLTKTLNQILSEYQPNSTRYYRVNDAFRAAYSWAKNWGGLSQTSTTQRNLTSAGVQAQVYVTKFKPIVTGPGGSLFQLFWHDSTNDLYVVINPNQYDLRPDLGEVSILVAAPSADYDEVVANYSYISNSNVEDFFSSVLNYVTTPASSTQDASGGWKATGRVLPITRNMTDYENGKIPTLRPPNFDRLDANWYPVIEYYVNNHGQIQFARDFFRFGDIPAEITIEFESLRISPRLGVEVQRPNISTVSPYIHGLSFQTRETGSIPIRTTT